MNLRLVLRLVSVILFTVAGAFLISFLAGSLAMGEFTVASTRNGWFKAIGITLAAACTLALAGRSKKKTFFRKEALATIGIGWFLASICGALPYLFLRPETSLIDAFFESVSGLTTTGASVFGNIESFPPSLLLWRSMSQWIGGLGVVVFFVAILSSLGAGARMLYSNEASAQSTDIRSSRIQEGVWRILVLYLALSVACLACLLVAGLEWFDAICHMMTTLSTGGFSTKAASVGAFGNPAVEWVIIVFMFIGGVSFLLQLRVLGGDWRALIQNSEFKAYSTIIVLGSAFIALMLAIEMPGLGAPESAIRRATFQVVSIITTTGFSTEDFTLWLPAGQVLLLVLMIFGGCAGSTSGGIKVVRILTALKICVKQVERSFRVRVIRPVRVNGRSIPVDEQEGVMTLIVLFAFTAFAGILLLALFEHQLTFAGVISAVISSLFNVGPGLEEVGPVELYDFLRTPSKMLLSILMIMGRLELYAVLALFTPGLWKRFS